MKQEQLLQYFCCSCNFTILAMTKFWLSGLVLLLHLSIYAKVDKVVHCKDMALMKWEPTMSVLTQNKAIVSSNSIVIPLKRAGKLILIEATVDSVKGNLILDTGSMKLVLNSIYFRDGRKIAGSVSGGVTGKVQTVSKNKIRRIQMADIVYENIDADIVDLGHLESVRNVKILGFYGLSMLKDFEIVIDLQANVLELHKTDNNGKRLNTESVRPSIDLSLPVYNNDGILLIQAKIGKSSYTFCLDTGAESNVLCSSLPDRALNTISVTRRSSLRGAGSNMVEVFHGIMNDFSVGKHRITGMQTMVTSLKAMSNAYGIEIDGMLGCDFFEQGIVFLDLKNKQMGIQFYKNVKE
jgi:predicted aspartyl protease